MCSRQGGGGCAASLRAKLEVEFPATITSTTFCSCMPNQTVNEHRANQSHSWKSSMMFPPYGTYSLSAKQRARWSVLCSLLGALIMTISQNPNYTMDSFYYSKLPPEDQGDDGYPAKPAQICEGDVCKFQRSCKGRPCNKRRFLKKLCKFIFFLFVLFLLVSTLIGIRTYIFIAQEVQQWTVTEPKDLPVVKVPAGELEVFKDQAKTFWDMIQADKVPNDFVVTSSVVNGFSSYSDFLRYHAFAEMKENQVKVSVSLPMDHFPGGKDRYLVGTKSITWDPETFMIHVMMDDEDSEKVFFDLYLHLSTEEDNKLNLQVISGKFLDWTVPQDFVDEHYNLLEDLYECDCHHRKKRRHLKRGKHHGNQHHHGDHERDDWHHRNHHDDDGPSCEETRKFLEALSGISLEQDQIVVHARSSTSEKEPFHRALSSETKGSTTNKKLNWKLQVGRRLVGF